LESGKLFVELFKLIIVRLSVMLCTVTPRVDVGG